MNIVLCFVKCLEFFEVCQCFCATAKVVVNLELPSDIGKILEGLEMWEVLSRVLHSE